MVQEYLNEIAPTLNGPNKLKTLGKPLRIADLQPPASGQDNPATLYIIILVIFALTLYGTLSTSTLTIHLKD